MPRQKPVRVTINANYRDEKCTGCGEKFRAGKAAEGYAHVMFMGYNPVSVPKDNIICPKCIHVIYRLLGNDPLAFLAHAPMAFHSYNQKTKSFGKRPTMMMIDGKNMPYNRKKLLTAAKKFQAKMKKLEPWSNVDYLEIAGVKKRK